MHDRGLHWRPAVDVDAALAGSLHHRAQCVAHHGFRVAIGGAEDSYRRLVLGFVAVAYHFHVDASNLLQRRSAGRIQEQLPCSLLPASQFTSLPSIKAAICSALTSAAASSMLSMGAVRRLARFLASAMR